MDNDKMFAMISSILNHQHEINQEIKRLLLLKPMSSNELDKLTTQLKVNNGQLSVLKDHIKNI